jgi:PTH1 family peptidyl-tRNA hydrolase
VLDRLAARLGLLFHAGRKLPGHGGSKAFAWARIAPGGTLGPALLVKPETYMNRSGLVVASVSAALAIPPERLLVAYDDLDLPLGKLRIRPHGGPGTHNGMRSIVECLGSDRFPRLRVGIGRPGTDAARHVLSEFDERERPEIEISIAEAVEAIEDWLASGDIEGCMTRFHSRWNQGA